MQDNLVNIRQLPKNLLKIIDRLIVNRVGNAPDAMMVTRDIMGHVAPNKCYQFVATSLAKEKPHQLTEVQTNATISTVPQPSTSARIPQHALLSGHWNKEELVLNPDASILGGFGSFILETETQVVIPVIEATQSELEFYNAKLLSLGSIIQFETTDELPIIDIVVGKQYVEHYLSKQSYGGGEYIEYHDQPHFWAPQSPECSGHILLGREIDNEFYLTGFRITFGYSIYLSPLTLHSDAYLVGNYSIVYTVTEQYSTVLFRNSKHEVYRLQFDNIYT